jgi:hypothetical protein
MVLRSWPRWRAIAETVQPCSARMIACSADRCGITRADAPRRRRCRPDRLQRGPGDRLGAVQHGLDRRRPHQPQQAADHPVAAAVQVAGQLDQAAGDVVMQPQACLQRGDERLPLLAAAERSGADHGEPSGDLLAAVAVEQPGAFDVDAGVDEGGRQPFREVLERVGGLSWPRDRASQVAPRTIVNGGS